MSGRVVALIGVVALGLLALACSGDTTVLQPSQERPGISVSGSGSAFGEPDVAVLSLGVEAEAESVSEARSQAAESMEGMLAALRDGGVAEEDIQTTRFSVEPRFDFIDGRQVLRGFVVNNLVTAKIREIDNTGRLIDAVVEAGGDLARVNNLRFTIDDPTELEDQARKDAMAEARRKAETLAEAAGVELGPPRSISESGGPRPIRFEAAGLAAVEEEFAETPIEVGELEVRVQVQVVYGLDGD